ncbi:DUF86 domain-containing protein [Candidatus Woesearchaeota archaeon]|nr:DUF86 domain-containing protein [Candidatus Woesearchaeota archaeon]
MKDETVYIEHILDAIKKIEAYIAKTTKERFMEKTLIQDAVIRQIEIIGEASKLISDETRKKSPATPWKDIAGMRDKLIHGYFGVDLDAVWKTVKKDIPSLKKDIKRLEETDKK